MLATQTMSGHGGQLPFGYNPHGVEGIGLPDYITPGPPVGQPILNGEEAGTLNEFFTDFDTSGTNQSMLPPYQIPPGQRAHFDLPPVYFGSETSGGAGQILDPDMMDMNHNYQHYGSNMPAHGMQPTHAQHHFSQGMHEYMDNSTNSNSLAQQLQEAASVVQQPQPGFTAQWNHPPFPPQGHPLQTPGRGPAMRFGSDSHFTQAGFQAQSNMMAPSENLDWLPSGPDTQPNTQPNTQPSSPNWSKKRKLDDFSMDQRNGFHGVNGHPAQPPPMALNSRQRSSHNVKSEGGHTSRPHSPFTTSKRESPMKDELPSDDAAAESDDDPSSLPTATNPTRSSSPRAPWPANKPRPPKSNKPPPPPKLSRKRKKSASASTAAPITSTPKCKAPHNPTRTPSTRVPLTSEQKKANHTNSEQRRRDATSRAFAELYDLVPEVADYGKTSTMKKLELVVDKVRFVIKQVETLKGRLGIAAGGSVAAAAERAGFGAIGLIPGNEYDAQRSGDVFGNGELGMNGDGDGDGDGNDGSGLLDGDPLDPQLT